MHLMSELTGWLSHGGARWRACTEPDHTAWQVRLEPSARGKPASAATAGRRPPHRMISSSRVIGAAVFDMDGLSKGEIRDLSIDKASGQVAYALIAYGGFLGLAEHIFPAPWMLLRYDAELDGYRLPFGREAAKAAPGLTLEDAEWFGAGDEAWRARLAAYYSPYLQAALF